MFTLTFRGLPSQLLTVGVLIVLHCELSIAITTVKTVGHPQIAGYVFQRAQIVSEIVVPFHDEGQVFVQKAIRI